MLNLTEIASRIKQPELCSSQDIDSLKTLCETYPYSQIFPLLYLKTLAQTNDVRLDHELHRFAYRIADRTVLYDLLNSKSEENSVGIKEEIKEQNTIVPLLEEGLGEVNSSIITSESISTNTNEIDSINQDSVEIIEPKDEIVVEEDVIEELVKNELTEDKVINQVDEEVSEITLTNETAEEDVIETSLSKETTPEEANPIELQTELPTLPDELLQSLHLGSDVYSLEAEEAKISKEKELEQERIAEEALELEKKKLIEALTPRKPLIEPVKEEVIEKERSFTSWLKQNSALVEPIEKIEEKVDSETLIEQFIQNEPKISQQKEKLFEDRTDRNELFNPMKKAKESLDDTQLPVSETLAKIFAAQGNFPKAIYAYQQLMLIFPEKKVFFASQIEELNKKINI